MLGSASMALRVGGALAAGAAVIAAAGCGTSSSSSTAPQGGAASTTPAASSPAATQPPATSAPASTPASSSSPRAVTGPTQTTGGSGGGGATACASTDLQVKVGPSEGAAGSAYQVLDFTNAGSKACTLYGYPGVSLSDGVNQVGAAATRSNAAAPAVVSLAPGATANSLLRITQAMNYPSSTCSPKATSYLHIFPPNQTVAINVAFKSTGCGKDAVKLLTIGVVQPGANSNQ